MAKITEDILWLKTGEPQDQVVLNRPLKLLHNDLKRYDIPLEISDSKGSNSEQVINQEQLTKMLSGWGSNELPEQPDGQDTMTNGVYKASGLDFGNDIDGKDGTLLVIGSETQTPGNKGEINQIVFGDGRIHTRYSDDQDQYGKPNWKEWTELVGKQYVDEAIDRIGLIDYGYVAKPYHIVAFGGEFLRADYPKLWAYLQANPSLVKTQAQWQSESTTNGGICGFFSSGNGTTTFRVPNLNNVFLRPSSRGVGSYQGDAIQNIEGTWTADELTAYHDRGTRSTGALYTTNGSSYAGTKGRADRSAVIGFDASRVVPTANENRPKNIAVLPLIVAK